MIPVTSQGHLNILRGDMVTGGAKMPALLKYLPRLNHSHFAYVGSVYGSGAWAVAEACSLLNFKCTLFVAKSDDTPLWLPELKKTGATLHWCDPLPVATLHQTVTDEYPDIFNLPLGFDDPHFIEDMVTVLRNSLSVAPPEIWVPTVSGVLARAACLAFPEVPIHAVCAAKHHGNIDRAIPHIVPEKYYKPALTPPPYPACPFSDAKIWQFAQKQAVSGAFILNVGI